MVRPVLPRKTTGTLPRRDRVDLGQFLRVEVKVFIGSVFAELVEVSSK